MSKWRTLTLTMTTSDGEPIDVRSITIDTGYGAATLRIRDPLPDGSVVTWPTNSSPSKTHGIRMGK